MSGALCHDLAVLVERLPLFLAQYNVHVVVMAVVGSVFVTDVIDPVKLLRSLAPALAVFIVGFELQQSRIFRPHRGQRIVFEHDHELPVVIAATGQHRPVGIHPSSSSITGSLGKAFLMRSARR